MKLPPLVLLSSLLLAACCGNKEAPADNHAKPGAKPGAHAAEAHHSTWGEATINAPNGSDGSPRRGIVRSAPDFNAAEVTRLNNGTKLNIIEAPEKGWYHVSWPIESDDNEGYIHGDVITAVPMGELSEMAMHLLSRALLFFLPAVVLVGGCCQTPGHSEHEPVEHEPAAPDSDEATPPEADPNQMAKDGLPVVIPPPGSKTPTVAEFNSVQREIRVKNSSSYGCETKMMREWLRVSCRKGKDALMTPSDVKTVQSQGQQAYPGVYGTTASLLVQVVQGKSYRASFSWSGEGTVQSAMLNVNWPASAARPSIYFDDEAHLSSSAQGLSPYLGDLAGQPERVPEPVRKEGHAEAQLP